METNKFTHCKGCLYLSVNTDLVKPFELKVPEAWRTNRIKRDGQNYHITIIKSTETIPEKLPVNTNWQIVGLKQTDQVAFLVVHYPAGDKFRKAHGLGNQDFHITLGWANKDVHDIDKSVCSLEPTEFVNLEFYKSPTLLEKQTEIMSRLYLLFPYDAEILSGLIDCVVRNQQWDLAQGYSHTLLELNPEKGAYSLLKLNQMFHTVTLELTSTIESKLLGSPIVNSEYSNYILSTLSDPKLINSNSLTCKYVWVNQGNRYAKLNKPRNCSEPYPRLFASAVVKESHTPWLKFAGVTCIVNLIEPKEEKPDDSVVNLIGRDYMSVPIPDRLVVSLEQTKQIIKKMCEAYDSDKSLLVHCMGGEGRTNMIVACFAMEKFGYKLSDIMGHLKGTRDVLVSKEQMELMGKYERDLQADPAYGLADKSCIKSNGFKCPKLIVLVGLPGSGKSTFSTYLISQIKSVIRVSQDDQGKKACYDTMSKNISGTDLIIVDRCNLKVSDRKEWTGYLKQSQSAWAIVFQTDPEECIYRAQHRPDHPTLKPTSAEKIIKDLVATYEPVGPSESFENVINIKSPDDLNWLLSQWGLQPIEQELESTTDIIKFPRTRHLANIGGASREDLLLDQADINEFLTKPIVIEEKIDGANMGISIESETYKILFQNRSHYVTASYAAQFKKLDMWRDAHQSELFEILEPGRHILYGEWVYSKHSIHYTKLPGYFVAFDLYDKKTGKFYSREKLESILAQTTIPLIRLVGKGRYKNLDQIIKLVNTESAYYPGKLEGVYVRICEQDYTVKRAKIVRSDFICGDTHWSKNKCVENLISQE